MDMRTSRESCMINGADTDGDEHCHPPLAIALHHDPPLAFLAITSQNEPNPCISLCEHINVENGLLLGLVTDTPDQTKKRRKSDHKRRQQSNIRSCCTLASR